MDSNTTIENAHFGSLNITGNDVAVRNTKVDGGILITGDRVTLDHVSTQGVAVSSASDIVVTNSNIGFGSEDAIHITSDRGRRVHNVTLSHNFIHDPAVPADAHYDGTQVRGGDGIVISCSTYDPGPYQSTFNAAVYLEDANGGDTNVVVRDNWLRGFGYTLMVDGGATITGNAMGGVPRWGLCDLGSAHSSAVVSTGNISESTGAPLSVCAGSS